MDLRIPLLSAILLLTACANQPRQITAIHDWERFAQQQQQLTRWQLEGKLGYRAPEDSGSAFINWQQQDTFFDLHLSGALGFGATRLRGYPQQVIMSRGNDTLTALSSGELTRQLLGMELPVEALTYWVRGIPHPKSPALNQQHGEQGELVSLNQQGWQLSFSRYQQAGNWLLPSRISGTQNGVSFKLIIKKWQPES